jgi:hypothetical protein
MLLGVSMTDFRPLPRARGRRVCQSRSVPVKLTGCSKGEVSFSVKANP